MEKNNIHMQRHSFDEVTYLDDALHQLAMYEVTGGKIAMPKTPEEVDVLQVKFAKKFNEFKTLIQNGDSTFEFIKWSVLDKNGPFLQKKSNNFNVGDINAWKEIEEAWQMEDSEINKKNKGMIDSLVNSFLGAFEGKDADGNEITIEPLDNLPEEPKEKRIPPKFNIKDELKKKKKPPKK